MMFFFVVDNKHNLERRAANKISQFPDDRWAWGTCGPSSKTYFVRQGQNLKTVVKRAGIYCKEVKQNKVKVFIPLEPQPDSAVVVLLHRCYTKHIKDASYEKRVSWLEYPGAPKKAVYEYKGKCPPPRPHGRVTTGNSGNYIRMLPCKMEKMKEALRTKRPAEVYTLDDSLEGAKNIRQV
jgi:hypothetical protein